MRSGDENSIQKENLHTFIVLEERKLLDESRFCSDSCLTRSFASTGTKFRRPCRLAVQGKAAMLGRPSGFRYSNIWQWTMQDVSLGIQGCF